MSAWARVAGGWALNLDGSDAAVTFSLPRLEVRGSAHGWRSVCLLANGTVSERPGELADSMPAARAAAIEQAGRMLGPALVPALRHLLPARLAALDAQEGTCAPSTS